MTVGPGITPGLLTLQALAGKRSRAMRGLRNYRRWGIAPRPENVAIMGDGGAFFSTVSDGNHSLLSKSPRLTFFSSVNGGLQRINPLQLALRLAIMRPFAVVFVI